MIPHSTLRTLTLTACCLCAAQNTALAASPTNASAIDYQLELNQGTKHEDFHWNIAGNPSPNTLSELTWRDMEQQYAQFAFTATDKNLLVRLEVDYGDIGDGENQDSDYLGDNRTQEYSRSYNATHGETAGIHFSAGHQFTSQNTRLSLTPLLGFSFYEQRLGMTDGLRVIGGYDTLDGSLPDNTAMPDLDSSYDSKWNTIWTGMETQWQLSPTIDIVAHYRYHFDIDYSAKANWNLRADFQHPVSFRHNADEGHGQQLNAKVRFAYDERLLFQLSYTRFELTARDGVDTTYLTNGNIETAEFNIAKTKASAWALGIAYRF